MKIIRPDIPSPVKGPQSGGPADRGDKPDFARVLEKATAVEQGAKPAEQAGGLSEPRPMSPISFTPEVDDAAAAQKLSEAVDLLDRYAADLGNPQKSLKDVAPLLDRLSELADSVEADRNAGMDPRLSGIARELVVAVRGEAVRFSRGDYVDEGR